MQVQCPLYLLTSTAACWKCSRSQSVVALGACSIVEEGKAVSDPEGPTDLFFLTAITSMPAEVFECVVLRNPRYTLRHSRASESTYYCNTCECGAHFGDFYLFSRPGGAFFPETEAGAARINYRRLPFTGALPFECSWSQGMGGFILTHRMIEP